MASDRRHALRPHGWSDEWIMSEWTAEAAETYGAYDTNRRAVDALAVAPDAVVVDVG